MLVLVVNAGSSSVKYALIDTDESRTLCSGIVERMGMEGTRLKGVGASGEKFSEDVGVADAAEALGLIGRTLCDSGRGAISSLDEIEAVGHRVVHGGEAFKDSVAITDEVKKTIRNLFPLAPLHNPPNYGGILGAEKLVSGVPHVAVFDTAFHSTIPREAFTYGLPHEYYKEHHIRRYGFHGTSHKYVSLRAAEMLARRGGLARPNLKLVTAHLGNGCSLTAVKDGKSVDTTMGFTPLEGVVMGTRSGTIDPAIIFFLMDDLGMSSAEVNELLNKKSGMLGLAGIGSSDMRDVEAAVERGEEQATMAFNVYCYRIALAIGAYAAAMDGLDALVFTAGVGENSPMVRSTVCSRLGYLGVQLDPERDAGKGDRIVSEEGSGCAVLVIHTQEDIMIARETAAVLGG